MTDSNLETGGNRYHDSNLRSSENGCNSNLYVVLFVDICRESHHLIRDSEFKVLGIFNTRKEAQTCLKKSSKEYTEKWFGNDPDRMEQFDSSDDNYHEFIDTEMWLSWRIDRVKSCS